MKKMSNIEAYKAEQRRQSENRVLSIVAERGQFESIMDLKNAVQDMSYGGVQAVVKRLAEAGKIFLANFYDEGEGVAKVAIFATREKRDAFSASAGKSDAKDLNLVPLSQLVTKTNLYRLFYIIMRDPSDTRSEDMGKIAELLKGKRMKIDDIQLFVINVIEKVMGIDIGDIMNIRENNEDVEVYL